MSQMTNPYIKGGKNKIIWGDAVTEGSSGGNTSYNSQTGQVHYINGYENDPVASPLSSTPNVAEPSSSSGSKPKASAPKAPAAPAAPVAYAPAGPRPAPVSPASSGGGSSATSPVVSPSMEALAGSSTADGVGGMGDMGGARMFNAPSRFRQGIGTRMMPQESASLAALRRIY